LHDIATQGFSGASRIDVQAFGPRSNFIWQASFFRRRCVPCALRNADKIAESMLRRSTRSLPVPRSCRENSAAWLRREPMFVGQESRTPACAPTPHKRENLFGLPIVYTDHSLPGPRNWVSRVCAEPSSEPHPKYEVLEWPILTCRASFNLAQCTRAPARAVVLVHRIALGTKIGDWRFLPGAMEACFFRPCRDAKRPVCRPPQRCCL